MVFYRAPSAGGSYGCIFDLVGSRKHCCSFHLLYLLGLKMLFNSFQFFLFFPLVCLFYFLLPARNRWLLLLLASAYFYAQFVAYYLLILAALVVLDFSLAIFLEKAEKPFFKKMILIFSVVANLSFLFVFKYYNFFLENLSFLFPSLGHKPPHLDLVLPIGLSFHVFQSIGYMVEVFSGRFKAERHLGYYALFVLFFPQLVAGPIERPQNLLPQLKREHHWNHRNVFTGIQWIVSGFLLKSVVADQLALIVNKIYGNLNDASGWLLLSAACFFSIQIYCDFAGYSAIAKGTAKIFGIDLQENFRSPFLSQSIPEFWTRWHISLGAWFQKYLYIPLGGNRAGRVRFFRNIFLVFLLSGLWHGARWGYVIFGALHGIFYLANTFSRKRFPRLGSLVPKALARFCVFTMVTFAFIFFRAPDLSSAFKIIQGIFYWKAGTSEQIGLLQLCVGFFLSGFLLFYEARKEATKKSFWDEVEFLPIWAKGMVGYAILFLLTMAFVFGDRSPQPFIYFQF